MVAPMSDGPDNLILRQLRSMDGKLDRIGDDVREMKGRLSALEQQYANVQRRLDRVDDRLERRLDLTESAG